MALINCFFRCVALACAVFSVPAASYAQALITKSIELPTFTAVSLETVGDLVIERDSKHRFAIEAEPKVVELIAVKVEDNVLRIFATGDFKTDKPIKLRVHLPKLNDIALRSSGDVLVGKWQSDKISLLVTGSGSINATAINADNAVVQITGTGDITLAGLVASLRAEIDGTGTIDATKLSAASATAAIDGSGDINLNVSSILKATVNGSGTITYLGNPKLTKSVQGAGEIIKQGL